MGTGQLTSGGSRPAAYLLAAGLGLAMVAWVFPVDAILGTDTYANPAWGDALQHIVGQRAFFQDAWHWPPLKTLLLMPPGGVNIGLTDGIPLAALPAKLLRGLLPHQFEAIRPWLALCWLLQPVAGVFALRGAGERRLLPALAVASVLLSMPTLFWRCGHAGLSSHFLLLTALGLYFRGVAGSRRAPWFGAALLPASLMVHPYLFPMCLALLAAAPLTLLARRDPAWRRCAAAPVAGTALVGLLVWQLGYLGARQPSGFGVYSMNLLSPFYPWLSWLLPNPHANLDVTGGQYEGYQYLGAGLLALLAGLPLLAGPALWRCIRRHAGLAAACLGLTLFAASNRMYLGHVPVLLMPRPGFLSQLRVTGRFFWPVAYVIAVGGIALAARRLPRRQAAALVAAVVVLQAWDVHAQRLGFRILMHEHRGWSIDVGTMRPLLAAHRAVSVWPGAFCWMRPETPALLHTLLLATDTRTAADTMYLSRSEGDTACPPAASLRVPPAEGEMRVFLPGSPAGAVLEMPDATGLCRVVGGLTVCSRQLAGRGDLPPFDPAPLPHDVMLPVSAGTVGSTALGGGWWAPDASGAAMIAPEADLATACRPGAPTAILLDLSVSDGMPRHVRIRSSGETLAEWNVSPLEPPHRIDLPADACTGGALKLFLHQDGALSGLKLRKIQLMTKKL